MTASVDHQAKKERERLQPLRDDEAQSLEYLPVVMTIFWFEPVKRAKPCVTGGCGLGARKGGGAVANMLGSCVDGWRLSKGLHAAGRKLCGVRNGKGVRQQALGNACNPL
jgi:hypothetical protein